jgi:hypothetical protein
MSSLFFVTGILSQSSDISKVSGPAKSKVGLCDGSSLLSSLKAGKLYYIGKA